MVPEQRRRTLCVYPMRTASPSGRPLPRSGLRRTPASRSPSAHRTKVGWYRRLCQMDMAAAVGSDRSPLQRACRTRVSEPRTCARRRDRTQSSLPLVRRQFYCRPARQRMGAGRRFAGGHSRAGPYRLARRTGARGTSGRALLRKQDRYLGRSRSAGDRTRLRHCASLEAE